MIQPLVSICIPVFNGVGCISKSIESCLAQTYPKIEIIVCDDCSSDDSLIIVSKLASKTSLIKIHKNPTNIGLVANWNKTLSFASGDYIKWMFQDDWMEPDAIEKFVAVALSGYDFVISKRNFVLEDQTSEKEKEYFCLEVKKLENHFLTEEKGHYFSTEEIAKLTTDYIALNFIAEPSLIFFKKSLIKIIGEYDNRFQQICDLEYNLRIASEVGVYVINEPLCSFAIHGDSTTKINIDKKYFQLRYIEQAYYAFKLLNDNTFFKIQKYFSFFQKLKLKMYYKYRMYEAGRYIALQEEQQVMVGQLEKFSFLLLNPIEKIVYFPLFKIIDILKSR